MTTYLKKLFTNNGTARGWLYILIAFGTAIGDDLWEAAQYLLANRDALVARSFVWSVDLPTLLFVAGSKLLIAGVACGNVLKAFLDQNLSNHPTSVSQTHEAPNP